MNLKKLTIIGIIGIFLLAFPIHFGYSILPNPISSIFFPVNESIWEHMKIVYTSILLFTIIKWLLIKKYNIKYNNLLLISFIESILGIIIFLIIYIPLYLTIGENMFINLGVLLLTIIIVENIGLKIQKKEDIKYGNIFSFIGIIAMYVLFGYLTYYPFKNFIFFDTVKEKYGIRTYLLTSQEPNHLQHNGHLEPSYHHVGDYKIYY